MGSTLSTAAGKEKCRDIINPLKEIVETRIERFRKDVESGNTEGDKLIQAHKIVGKLAFFRVDVTDGEGQLAKKILEDTSYFVAKGSTRVAGVASQIICDMLARSPSTVCEERNYFATTDDMGGVYRLDVVYITYTLSADSAVRNIVAGYIIKSSLDMETMDSNTLRIIVTDSFADSNAETRFQLYESIADVVLDQDEEKGKKSKTLQDTWTRRVPRRNLASSGGERSSSADPGTGDVSD